MAVMQNLWDNMLQKEKFNGRYVFHELLPDSPNMIQYKLVKYNKARPRAIMVLWMICHGKLATKARLQRLGMIDNSKCIFCDRNETVDHLFFYCLIFKQTWSKVLYWLRIQHDPVLGMWS